MTTATKADRTLLESLRGLEVFVASGDRPTTFVSRGQVQRAFFQGSENFVTVQYQVFGYGRGDLESLDAVDWHEISFRDTAVLLDNTIEMRDDATIRFNRSSDKGCDALLRPRLSASKE